MKLNIVRVLLCILLVSCISASCFATSPIDPAMDGSIRIKIEYQDKVVSGGSLTVYQVAELKNVDGEYSFVFTKSFENCNLSLTDLNKQETAAKYSEFAIQHGAQGVTQKINAEGVAKFEYLSLGLYLVVQQEAANGYYPITPFLISVPKQDGETWAYDVDATPKIDIEREPQPETPPVKPNIPQTGQLKWPIPVLAISGVFLFGIGCVLCFKGKRKE